MRHLGLAPSAELASASHSVCAIRYAPFRAVGTRRVWRARPEARLRQCRAVPAARDESGACKRNFECRGRDDVVVGVIGDLHLKDAEEHLFSEAQRQMRRILGSAPVGRVVQLGDVGSGKLSGTREAFLAAKGYLEGLGVPFMVITGNHDLEGPMFETDEENLAAWADVFNQRHFWSADVGPAVLVGLSTVRYRSNPQSHHEVYIDEEQIRWFEDVVRRNRDKPVVVFSHAPPLGCGLKVVQDLHVKNRCCWLNHSGDALRFLRICHENPNIRVWFSGHFHLSHNYRESISSVGTCTFVQTGVQGNCNRDGLRQSRLLRLTSQGYEVQTLDHESGQTRVDVRHDWQDMSPAVSLLGEEELLCDPDAGWLCGRDSCAIGEDVDGVRWFAAGGDCMLAQQGGLLVEYSVAGRAPVGVVTLDAALPKDGRGWDCWLEDAAGKAVVTGDGLDAAFVVLRDVATGEEQRFPRNEQGTFYRIFQPNKWQKMLRQRQISGAEVLA